MTTYLPYQYRDSSNYKQTGLVALTGPLDRDQIAAIAASLDEGEFFIPAQVGLPATPFSESGGEDDHPWHNMENVALVADDRDEELEYYEGVGFCDAVSREFTPEELTAAFVAVGRDGWDGSV